MRDLDAEYIARMEDLLDLYERPLDPDEPVFCLDEKPKQLLAETRPVQVLADASIRRDYEYRRAGTANVFCGVEPKGGRHFARVTPTRSSEEFAWTLLEIALMYPDAIVIHLVVDNLSTHSKKAVLGVFGPVDGELPWRRFQLHYPPKHGSWLNQAEIEISLFSRECLGRRRFETISALRRASASWARKATRARRTINWRFTTENARSTFRYRRPSSHG